MPDIVIPIVFPDYKIAVNTPSYRVNIPDLLPGIDILPDRFVVPKTENKFGDLGHAGVLFINGSSGLTKYYEYGRYLSANGETRRVPIKDVIIGGDGHPTKPTLSYALSQISSKSGQGGYISGAYIEVPGKFQNMLNYAIKREKDNHNPNRPKYDLLSNSCNHFMKSVLDAADVETPYMIDPRPNSYIEEIRDDFRDLDYRKSSHSLVIENPPISLASVPISQPAA